MQIENWHRAEAYRKFDDLNGRGTYTLAYWEWKPNYGVQIDEIKGNTIYIK